MSASKKSKAIAKKPAAKKASTKKPNTLHEKLIKLFTRPNGATLTDTKEAGFKYPAMAALRTGCTEISGGSLLSILASSAMTMTNWRSTMIRRSN